MMCIFQHILIHSDQHEEVRNQLIDEVNQELAMEVLFDITLNDGKYGRGRRSNHSPYGCGKNRYLSYPLK